MLILEVIDQICNERSLIFLFVEHSLDEIAETRRVLRYRFWILVNDCVEKIGYVICIKWRFKRCHCVECNTHRPYVTSLVVALILDNFRRET